MARAVRCPGTRTLLGVALLLCVLTLPACHTLQVVDRDAQPVAGAQVWLYWSGSMEDLGVTNRSGRVCFWSFLGGNLSVWKDGVNALASTDADPLLVILPLGDLDRARGE